jgi:multiple antibiotic resistance protein
VDFGFFVLVFSSVFLVTDPIGNIPLFRGFLEKFTLSDRVKTIRKSHLVAVLVFFVFSFFGPHIFSWMSIDFFSFKIAGGLLLLVIGGEMLLGFKTRTEITPSEQEAAEAKENLAITPLGIPLITGPGAITTGIVLLSKAQGSFQIIEFVAASLLAFLLGFFLFLQSERLFKHLGPIGMKIITRIMGLLLMSLAIQFILTGLKESGLFMLTA